jgi:molybdopterin synthase catalytic subunit
MTFSVAVQQDDFDVGQEYSALVADNNRAGAIVFFVGRVRDFNDGKNIARLSLEHYPGMTEKILEQLIAEARQRWELISARIVHRVGDLHLGDQIVFVGATSAHREDAFHAAEFLMDFLKSRAPFWKKEFSEKGESNWVEAKNKDTEAAERWN